MTLAAAQHESPTAAAEAAVWALLGEVCDPEIPILSIIDLGIVRHVRWHGSMGPYVGLTPTYTGCPATEVIRGAVEAQLHRAGYAGAVVEEVLSPAWTSDWLSVAGRQKLIAFGIAPPAAAVGEPRGLLGAGSSACPRCASRDVQKISEFGSTPCKSHFRCNACLEPFDQFKCI